MVLSLRKQRIQVTHEEEVFVLELDPSVMSLLRKQFTRLTRHPYIVGDTERNSEEFHRFMLDLLEHMEEWQVPMPPRAEPELKPEAEKPGEEQAKRTEKLNPFKTQ